MNNTNTDANTITNIVILRDTPTANGTRRGRWAARAPNANGYGNPGNQQLVVHNERCRQRPIIIDNNFDPNATYVPKDFNPYPEAERVHVRTTPTTRSTRPTRSRSVPAVRDTVTVTNK